MTTLLSSQKVSAIGEAMISFLHNLGADKINEEASLVFKDKENKQKKVNILHLILDQHHLLWKKATDKDIESFYYIIAFLLKELSASNIDLFLPSLVDSIKSEKNDRTHLRLSLLKGIYNWFPEREFCKTNLYQKILEYALETDHSSVVVTELDYVENTVTDWNFPPEKKENYLLLRLNYIKI